MEDLQNMNALSFKVQSHTRKGTEKTCSMWQMCVSVTLMCC